MQSFFSVFWGIRGVFLKCVDYLIRKELVVLETATLKLVFAIKVLANLNQHSKLAYFLLYLLRICNIDDIML